jgi:hypothetical protein
MMKPVWTTWAAPAAGLLLVAVVLRDIFHTLIHPAGQGTLARLVFRALWRVPGRLRRPARPIALVGPLGVVLVIVVWAVLVVVGWALVYWPFLPDGFSYSQNLDAERRSSALDAVYVSLVTMATLGFGDVVPVEPWLRLAAPLEALVGFALLTAAVSWVLQVYPALARRRVLALRLDSLCRADPTGAWVDDGSSTPATVLHGLATEVAAVRVDLTQYAETYYFRDPDHVASIAAELGVACGLAERAVSAARGDVRLAGRTLRASLEDLAERVDRAHLAVGGSMQDVLDAFAADHGRTPRRLDAPGQAST